MNKMYDSNNKDKKLNKKETRPNVIACKLSDKEKADFNQLVNLLEVETPSEAIRYIIKETLNNVS
jgi:hypothetical protein